MDKIGEYNDYVSLGCYDSYGWVLDVKNQGLSDRTVNDLLKGSSGFDFDSSPSESGLGMTNFIVSSRNCIVYGKNYTKIYFGREEYESLITVYYYGMFAYRSVDPMILRLLNCRVSRGKEGSEPTKIEVSYVAYDGEKTTLNFEFDLSKIKIKA